MIVKVLESSKKVVWRYNNPPHMDIGYSNGCYVYVQHIGWYYIKYHIYYILYILYYILYIIYYILYIIYYILYIYLLTYILFIYIIYILMLQLTLPSNPSHLPTGGRLKLRAAARWHRGQWAAGHREFHLAGAAAGGTIGDEVWIWIW